VPTVALIVSAYNQPDHLDRCLLALGEQSHTDFELIIADDGSDSRTRAVIDKHSPRFKSPIRHLWQEDRGFRKTRILNKALLSTGAEYLVFMDGDCVAHRDFVKEHLVGARPGHYLNGAMIRLNPRLTDSIDQDSVHNRNAFRVHWLVKKGRTWNRRFLRLSLNYRSRCWLNQHSKTKLYWLGANSSCWRKDALAVNGFDNRFTYGFEDGDFGNRLENYGLSPETVRWTANILHLFHAKPWDQPGVQERNLALVTPKQSGGVFRADDGADRLANENAAEIGAEES
jgi:glycosyltransferase involved in cell wall biosynthesis